MYKPLKKGEIGATVFVEVWRCKQWKIENSGFSDRIKGFLAYRLHEFSQSVKTEIDIFVSYLLYWHLFFQEFATNFQAVSR
uniref:Uncharacterized protein n=1 Tax=Octopus bimaculoides TaxID=37653 RepID=A0A0L8GXE3_OCTBM